MELHDFAEQILFATTLDEKLRCPETISDTRPGSPLIAPEAPGRPLELRFKPARSGKADFPGAQHLDREQERGRLLHFFANHELLATELMALVLLRFPEAPSAFRRGVLQTLKDEQNHTRLYLERMKQCGIEFGQIPVSGYFWRAVSAMQSPMDYVAGLSLTFEQANLDFCCQFARGFAAVGDGTTARLLEGIYRDEIGHVAYGLKWLRRWKNPQESDWEAFCRQLKFPLSPQRAKGTWLNIEGRRAAGLDAAFIDELSVYAQSKGRTPSVFVFNPFAEGYIARGKCFTPVKHQKMLAADLENLPQFLCRQDDIVLVSKRPSVEFLRSVKEGGFSLPEFVEMGEFPNQPRATLSHRMGEGLGGREISKLTQRKLGRLRPWAWGPDSLALLNPLFSAVSGDKRCVSECFNEGIAQLYSKVWSAALLKRFLRTHSSVAADQPWLCTGYEAGVAVDTLDAALAAIKTIRQRGHHKVIAKQALGLAGHNAIRLWEPELLEKQRRWMTAAFHGGQRLVIEPWLERELDFSIQLEMSSDGLKLRGYTGLINDARGQFRANWAEPDFARRVPARVRLLLRNSFDISNRLDRLYTDLFSFLESELRRAAYLGPVGIDAFVYRSADGQCRLKPIVEINPRYTMGRLALELMNHVRPGRCGLFRLIDHAAIRKQDFKDFASYACRLKEQSPVRLEGDPIPRLGDGAVCLNDPAHAQVCLAIFQVEQTVNAIARVLA